jgi:surface antigen
LWVLQIIHQRIGILRKHQVVWNCIRQRKVSRLVVCLSIVALLNVLFIARTQRTQVDSLGIQFYLACPNCVSQALVQSDNQESLKYLARIPKPDSTHGTPVSSKPTPHTSTSSGTTQSPPAKGTPLPTQGSVNIFPYGSCTWWANQRYFQLHGIFVPWRTQANAWQWTARAYQSGWHVSSSPVVGSIIDLQPGVQGASPSAGHVGIVEKILSNGHVITSNMNWGVYYWEVVDVEFVPGPGVTFIYK